MYGKTIEMFLVDGTVDGVVTAELSNWNGKAIKLPRTEVADCQRDDVQGVGVYFLFCPEGDGFDSVYIGEAENILKRLRQHLQDYRAGKETYFWNTAVAFTGRDLNKALIRYLEDRLVAIARECGQSKVLTKVTYETKLKEAQKASMEEFIDNVKVLLNSLGYRTLALPVKHTDETKLLFCRGSGAEGRGFVSAQGFTVIAGSSVSDHIAESFKTKGKSYWRLRNRLIENGVIENRVFVRDYEFTAPSAASAVILGRTSNGNVDWKSAEGTPLREL